jgi:RimJ/RimL family protein N-acetyltransferase/predicted SprT family Zn-dependent metalloprotease
MGDWLARPAPYLYRGLVNLEPLDESVLEPYLEMLADPEGNRLTTTTQKFTREKIVDWLKSRPLAEGRLDWAIRDARTGEFVGEIVLNDFVLKSQQMGMRIALRSPAYYNRGYGSAAIEAVMTFAFDKLKLKRVELEVWVENPRALSTYEKFGFVQKRTRKDRRGFEYIVMHLTKSDFVKALAERKMAEHLDLENWKFEFDNGKRRAGLCNYDEQKIQLSKYLVAIHSVDESMQVVLHEIAHAMSGHEAGHSKKWLATAKKIGYRAEKFTGKEIAEKVAPWVGVCPMGHEHYRYRKPTAMVSCAFCSKNYDSRNLIRWTKRSTAS